MRLPHVPSLVAHSRYGFRHTPSALQCQKNSIRCVSTIGDRTLTGPLVYSATSPVRPMSLSGGHGFQSTQLMARVVFRRRECLNGDRVLLARFQQPRHVKLIGTIRASDLGRCGQLLTIYPDIRSIVDAAETQPECPSSRRQQAPRSACDTTRGTHRGCSATSASSRRFCRWDNPSLESREDYDRNKDP